MTSGPHKFANPPVGARARYNARSHAALSRALNLVPAYRSWRALDPGPQVSADERYAAMPAFTKADLKAAFPAGMTPAERNVEDGLRRGEISYAPTSGTTSERHLNIWHQPWWDASERLSWELNARLAAAGLGGHREALLASPLSVGRLDPEGRLSMDERCDGRILFLNGQPDPARWTDGDFERMTSELACFAPKVLEANPAFLTHWAEWLLKRERKPYRPEAIVMTFEFPSRLARRTIAAAFGVPLVSSYGTTETGYVFTECECGNYHQVIESCRVDFQPWQESAGGPQRGRILITPFDNPWAVFVRFDPGDLVTVAAAPCPCGRRTGLTLSAMEGRGSDLTQACTGRPLTTNEVDAVLAAEDGLRQYQLTQAASGALLLRCRASCPTTGMETALRRALAGLYGSALPIEIAFVDAIAPEASGKHRLTILQQGLNTAALLETHGERMSKWREW
ncbi:MAG: hypothetical protein WCL16_04555 [bacterium]